MNNRGIPNSLPLPGRHAAKHKQVSQCVISFGSNLGDRCELIAAAARRVSQSKLLLAGDPLRTSRLFETPPIGGPGGQEPFLNAIGVFQTESPARAVLAMLQELEMDLGRQRRRRWDARSIDLDVVLHGNLVGGTTGLVVPHPRYTARQFVLRPACDVAAGLRDPRFGWTLQEISDHLSSGIPSLALVTGRQEIRDLLCQRLADEHGVAILDPEEYKRAELESSARGSADLDQILASHTPSMPRVAVPGPRPWVCNFLPKLPNRSNRQGLPCESWGGPRLLVRIQKSTNENGWPAPHQMWPGGWHWPEYRLEIDDLDWAVAELASALDSMCCSAQPVTLDGCWW